MQSPQAIESINGDTVASFMLMSRACGANPAELKQMTGLSILLAAPWLTAWSFGPIVGAATWVSVVLPLVVIAVCFPRRRDLRTAVQFALCAAALLSLSIGLVQLGGANSHVPLSLIADSPLREAYGNLRQKNQYATLMTIGLVAWMSFVSKMRSKGGLGIAIAAVGAALMTAGNAMSASRTGLAQLGLVIVSALWVTRFDRRYWSPLVAAIGGYLLGSMLPVLLGSPAPTIWERQSIGGEGCASRLVLWRNVIDLILERPFAGWGWGKLDEAHFLGVFPYGRFCDILDNAHNLPLHLAVELGIPVALAATALVVWFMARTWPGRVPRSAAADASAVVDDRSNPFNFAHMAWFVLAAILLHSLLEYPLWYGPFQLTAWLCVAILWPARRGGPILEKSESKPAIAQRIRTSIAIILIACIGYVAYDYWRVSQIFIAPEDRAAAYQDDTLAKVQATVFFQPQAKFAKLTMTPVTRANAADMLRLARETLAYSPEPRVIEKLLDAARLTGRQDIWAMIAARYEAAFPAEYARWRAGQSAVQ